MQKHADIKGVSSSTLEDIILESVHESLHGIAPLRKRCCVQVQSQGLNFETKKFVSIFKVLLFSLVSLDV